MRYVLAIDPGTDLSAYVLWSNRLEEFGILRNAELNDLLRRHEWGSNVQCVIEMVASYGMPVGAEIFQTVLWIGRFVESWRRRFDHDPELIFRREVKLHHCGKTAAKDSNIRQSLVDKYGKPGTKSKPGLTYGLKKDIWQAFALATYIAETRQTEAVA